jgi:multidrug efflux pump subunit AcrA (membrane-fusion protein)
MGERKDSLWIVAQGLNPGERVVVEGAQKIRDGMVVTPKPFQPETAQK